MVFNKHWQLEGKHAFLGASKYHWIRYDLDKMKTIWENKFASERGTRLHRIAADLIRERITMPRNNQTLNAYVNDAIGFRMSPEVILRYSDRVFGTTDAISFEKLILRIHDLKTGKHAASFDQEYIYAALYCLEYKVNPFDIEMIFRIYQNDEMYEHIGVAAEVKRIMDQAVLFDKEIAKMEEVML